MRERLRRGDVAAASDRKGKHPINPNDNISPFLEKEFDLPVTLRLKSGAEISGTAFYGAVANIDAISVPLCKARKH